MDIGPISGIRPITAIKPSPSAPDLSRVFEVEYLGESEDDDTSRSEKAARGLEDEEPSGETPETDEEPGAGSSPRPAISFFA